MKINFKGIAVYIFLIIVSVLFMLYLDGPGGGYLLIALVTAAIISLSLCIYTRYCISLKTEVNSDVLNCGDIATVTVTIGRKGIIPTSLITAELYSSYHFIGEDEKAIRTVVFGKDKYSRSFNFRAEFFGKGKIGIGNITVSDYLGLLSFRLNIPGVITSVKIYPDIPEINGREGLARSLADAAAFDDSEETTQSAFSISGYPGYEHRKYEPGDSLKLINWKLSAKRRELLVRKLEGSLGSEQVFILDRAASPEKDNLTARSSEQLIIEALLGLMGQFAKSELPVKLVIRFDEVWEEISVTNLAELSDLRYRFTDFTFSSDSVGRLPDCDGEKTVIFSACPDSRFLSYIENKPGITGVTERLIQGSDKIWRAERDNKDIIFTK